MNLKFQLTRAFILSVISLAAFALMATLIEAHKIVQFDSTIISSVQGLESPALTAIMKFFTFIGSTKIVVILSLLIIFFLYKVLHHRLELILFIAVIAGTPIINSILKSIFHRARPEFHRLIEIGGYSFPSGHAMNAFSVYGILAFLLWRHIATRTGRILLIIFSTIMILMIGISRIYLGVHYPSDIIGGYFASGFWMATAIWFFQWYVERRPQLKGRQLKRT
ncbi:MULTISPECIES: phosphatase PAP2 family protein [Neobacillus]|uniref:Phosphatase PAP2 family protein n=1 Tax=Neobacillus rhizophilus TaxID=2833579 RepID=A0A942U7K8_9BACI|nr:MULTISPECIES: phosphatase PAP2 family protein [Neobacillus]MBS4214402.1 phosphatase PAP2 family protein [Neobacillus rhizophilus]